MQPTLPLLAYERWTGRGQRRRGNDLGFLLPRTRGPGYAGDSREGNGLDAGLGKVGTRNTQQDLWMKLTAQLENARKRSCHFCPNN